MERPTGETLELERRDDVFYLAVKAFAPADGEGALVYPVTSGVSGGTSEADTAATAAPSGLVADPDEIKPKAPKLPDTPTMEGRAQDHRSECTRAWTCA